MKQFTRTLAFGIGMVCITSGCTVVIPHKPAVLVDQLRAAPPDTVAVLPFDNQSDHPLAAGIARDTLFYALADRGFRLLDLDTIDSRLADPQIAAALRLPDGRVNAKATRAAFGVDAIAYGRVLSLKPLPIPSLTLMPTLRYIGFAVAPRAWTGLEVQVWLIDTRSGQILWNDTGPLAAGKVDLPRFRQRPLTPAERQQYILLRLCRAFDALWARLARNLPEVTPQRQLSQLAARKPTVKATRPIVSPGDRVDIAIEAAPISTVRATLGTLGQTIDLAESTRSGTSVYRGSYTIQPGDRSSYCRVAVTIESDLGAQRRIADSRSGFIVDTTPPAPPTGLASKIQPGGVALHWDRSPSPDVAHYWVYRAAGRLTGVRPVGHPVENQFIDRSARGPGQFVYFVKAIDRAGNPSSSSAEIAVTLPQSGPSRIGGRIEGVTRWTALGGPYRISSEDVDVAPGARLIIEPGVRVDIPAGMEITVRGTVEVNGTEENPVRVVCNDAARAFFLADPTAVLVMKHAIVSGARNGYGIEMEGGDCRLDHVEVKDNLTGLDGEKAKRLEIVNCAFLRNGSGAIVNAGTHIGQTDFVQNDVGLRILGDGVTVERCRFDDIQLDIVKIGRARLAVDGNTFWTADPSKLFRHLAGPITCRSILVRSAFTGRVRPVQFAPIPTYLERGDTAALGQNWERALRNYEAVLLQEYNREIIDKVLKMYKQIVDTEGLVALHREIAFCRSAVLAYPDDLELLRHLAGLYALANQPRLAKAVKMRIQRLEQTSGS